MTKKLKSISSIVVHCIVFYHTITDQSLWSVEVTSLKLRGRTKVKARRAPITSFTCATVYNNVRDSTLEAIKEILNCTMKWKLLSTYFPNGAVCQMHMYWVFPFEPVDERQNVAVEMKATAPHCLVCCTRWFWSYEYKSLQEWSLIRNLGALFILLWSNQDRLACASPCRRWKTEL